MVVKLNSKYLQQNWICHFEECSSHPLQCLIQRTNNPLEGRNHVINVEFGTHPCLYDFAWQMSQHFEDVVIACNQFVNHGTGNVRHPREALKQKVLLRLWDFIDKNQTEQDILLLLSETSKAMKCEKKKLMQMLNKSY